MESEVTCERALISSGGQPEQEDGTDPQTRRDRSTDTRLTAERTWAWTWIIVLSGAWRSVTATTDIWIWSVCMNICVWDIWRFIYLLLFVFQAVRLLATWTRFSATFTTSSCRWCEGTSVSASACAGGNIRPQPVCFCVLLCASSAANFPPL